MQLTREQLVQKIRLLPVGSQRDYATKLAVLRFRDKGLTRDIVERRSYLHRPADYMREILGVTLTPQQVESLALIDAEDRVLIPKGNNTGGTFLLAAYGLYVFDVLAAQPDTAEGLEQQGARVILMGPDHSTIESTIYAQMLLHARRAEARNPPKKMPGRKRSEDSVNWTERPDWTIEAFAPPKYTMQEQAHSASGRHAKVQVILITEGAGVHEALWRAADGLASSRGNKIISETNPTESGGSFYKRARSGAWRVLHLSALDHPNVRTRTYVVPGAIDYRAIDDRVRVSCQDRGAYPDVQPDATFEDFVYALAQRTAEDKGARRDGQLGHPAAPLRVYRPGSQFAAQVLGRWPKGDDAGLFSPAALDAAVDRWRETNDPDEPPDRVGVDCAREGNDDTCAAPAWGEDAASLLRALRELELAGDAAGLEALRATRRVRVGEIRAAPKGDGPSVAQWLALRYGSSPWCVDESGVGSSVLDHARHQLKIDADGISFSESPEAPLPGESTCDNLKATLYVRAAAVLRYGLCDAPDDPVLREELLAHELVYSTRSVERVMPDGSTHKVRVPSVRVLAKEEVKKKIGRSPDKADAFVLALFARGGPTLSCWVA